MYDVIERDAYILEKYEKGRDVDPEDKELVEELASMGLMKTGISTKRGKMTAKTIELGRKLIE